MLAALAIYKHKANIKRLLNGTENRHRLQETRSTRTTKTLMKITVVGAGAWGTALARLLCEAANSVTLWGHIPEYLDEIRAARPQRALPPGHRAAARVAPGS